MRLLHGAHRAYRRPGRDLRRQASVAVIASFGFLNRFNDTLATELEASRSLRESAFSQSGAGRSASTRAEAQPALPPGSTRLIKGQLSS
jgi:hypothetical protein